MLTMKQYDGQLWVNFESGFTHFGYVHYWKLIVPTIILRSWVIEISMIFEGILLPHWSMVWCFLEHSLQTQPEVLIWRLWNECRTTVNQTIILRNFSRMWVSINKRWFMIKNYFDIFCFSFTLIISLKNVCFMFMS